MVRQTQALHVMSRGDSVFLTGPAGSGKTYVLNQFIDLLKKQKKQVAITASTGIAATHIGGTTIHSWSGLGIRDSLSQHDIAWLKNNDRLSKRYNATEVLIIDEVSMLHGRRLNMVSDACKILRRNNEPFGGMQVIVTGDLFQLPPVNREGGPDDFAHISAAWQELDPKICYLTEQHRQEGDELLDLLSAMRDGTLDGSHHSLLTERIGREPSSEKTLTRLYAHNVDVEAINDDHLQALDGESQTYTMLSSGRAKNVEQLQKSVLAPESLVLKKGAEVMFVANNFAQGFVNGSRGQVVDFDGERPIVELQKSGKIIEVQPHSWTLMEDGRERARVTQLPLRLAWAITIHKSQGMSLDSALIDLGRSFTYGMGYVALSRLRSMDGLYLAGINRVALQLHPDIYAFDARLRRASEELANVVGEILDTPGPDIEPERYNTELFEALRNWRMEESQKRGVSAFVVAHNRALEAIATRQPRTEQQLLALKGVGKKFVESYGPGILDLVRKYQTDSAPFDVESIFGYIEEQGIPLSREKREQLKRLLNE
jgi:ATP-dependent DNA helicase PIF1